MELPEKAADRFVPIDPLLAIACFPIDGKTVAPHTSVSDTARRRLDVAWGTA